MWVCEVRDESLQGEAYVVVSPLGSDFDDAGIAGARRTGGITRRRPADEPEAAESTATTDRMAIWRKRDESDLSHGRSPTRPGMNVLMVALMLVGGISLWQNATRSVSCLRVGNRDGHGALPRGHAAGQRGSDLSEDRGSDPLDRRHQEGHLHCAGRFRGTSWPNCAATSKTCKK